MPVSVPYKDVSCYVANKHVQIYTTLRVCAVQVETGEALVLENIAADLRDHESEKTRNLYSITPRRDSSFRNWQSLSYSRNFPPFMEPEDLLPYCSQEYASFQVFINLPFM